MGICVCHPERSEGNTLSLAALGMTVLEVSPEFLLAFDRFEQRLEIPLPERLRALPLNDLIEQRRAILHRLAEDLEEIAVRVAIDEDAELRELTHRLVDLADAALELLVVARRDG